MNSDERTNKRAGAWEVSDIEKLVGTEEGIYREFKKPSEFVRDGKFSPDFYATELSETVSAFLNSDGGVLLIGVQTDKHNKDRKTEVLRRLEAWSSDQTFEHLGISLTASQIRDVIYGNIVPKPTGIEVKELTVPIGKATATVFVVTVAPSPLGAHQSVRTKRYYRRTADGDEPMLDFEVRAVNSRRAGPLLYLACKVSDIARTPFEEDWEKSSVVMERVDEGRYRDVMDGVYADDKSFYRVDLVFATSNFGQGTADIARFDIGIPNPWQIQQYSPDGTNVGAHWVSHSGLQHIVGDQVTVFWMRDKLSGILSRHRNSGISEQIVLWQQVIYSGNETPGYPIWPTSGRRIIGVIRLQRQNDGNVASFSWLPWQAFAIDMTETRGAVLLMENASKLYIFNYDIDDVWWWYHAEGDQKFEELKQRFKVS